MKKYLIFIFVLAFSIFLFACGEQNSTIKLLIEIDDFGLSDIEEKVEFDIDFDNEDTLGDIQILEVNILYTFKNCNKEELLEKSETIKLDTVNINQIEENEYYIVFDNTKYHSDLSVIVEVKLSDNTVLYSNLVCVNIFNLAKAEYENNEVAANIYYYKRIREISLEIDLNEKSFEGDEENYSFTYSNPKYEIITIVITLKGENLYSDDFVLKLNGDVIKSKDYKIEGNVLTYEFDDPNWTDIY